MGAHYVSPARSENGARSSPSKACWIVDLHSFFRRRYQTHDLLEPPLPFSPLSFPPCYVLVLFHLKLSFYVPLLPMPRGEGSFAALLRQRRDQVFGDDYDHTGGDTARDDVPTATSNWRSRPLPLAARTNLVRGSFLSGYLLFCLLWRVDN